MTTIDWDAAADSFDEEPDHGLNDPVVRGAWARRMETWLPTGRSAVLDLGCGTGSLALLVAGQGHRVTAVDRSSRMVDQARAKLAGTGTEVLVGDAAHPPVGKQRFDVILARHLVWLLPDPAAVLRHWFSLLRPGGRLVLIEGVWDGAGIPAADLMALLGEHTERIHHEPLSGDSSLWGKKVDDERYALVARAEPPHRHTEVVDVHLILRRGSDVLLARRAGDRVRGRAAPRTVGTRGGRRGRPGGDGQGGGRGDRRHAGPGRAPGGPGHAAQGAGRQPQDGLVLRGGPRPRAPAPQRGAGQVLRAGLVPAGRAARRHGGVLPCRPRRIPRRAALPDPLARGRRHRRVRTRGHPARGPAAGRGGTHRPGPPHRAVGPRPGRGGRGVGLAAGRAGPCSVPALGGRPELAARRQLCGGRAVACPGGAHARPAASGPQPPGVPRPGPRHARRAGGARPRPRLAAALPGPPSVRRMGSGHYAAYLENTAGFEVELVAP